jgi:hypothetical protein
MSEEGNEEIRECEECGSIAECMYVPDPFGYEMYDNTTMYWMCDDCRDERAAAV